MVRCFHCKQLQPFYLIDFKLNPNVLISLYAATATLSNSEDNLSQYAMQILHNDIAAQKNHIMKNLGLKNNAQLNEDIAKLQLLQKQYLQYERDNVNNCSFDYNDTNVRPSLPSEADRHSADSVDVKSSITYSSYRCDSYISRTRIPNDCKFAI